MDRKTMSGFCSEKVIHKIKLDKCILINYICVITHKFYGKSII